MGMSTQARVGLSALLLLGVLTGWGAESARPAFAVVEKAAGFVGFYSEDGRRVGEVKAGNFPHEGVLSWDGRWLYVTDNGVLWMTDEGEGDNTVTVIDVGAMRKAGTIDLGPFRRPHGIALDASSGRLLVTTERPHGLLMIDAAARKVLRDYDVKGKSPHMVTLGPGGQWAYVSNTDSDAVAAVHLKTGQVKLIPTAGGPQGGVQAPGGDRLYVVCGRGNRITVIDTAHQEAAGTIQTGQGPGRIAMTPDGKTLVYNLQGDQAVGFADVASGKQVATIALGGRPLSLTLARDGQRAFSSVQDQDKVFVISVPERRILRVFNTPKGAGPDPVIPLRE
jgi:YVTN family beta-propeller protein